MEDVYQTAEMILRYVVEFSTLLLEFFGICILVFTAVKCFLFWIKKDESIRLRLAQGIALALEFKLGGEVLRTVVVREWAELGILGAIIALRAALTFLIPLFVFVMLLPAGAFAAGNGASAAPRVPGRG